RPHVRSLRQQLVEWDAERRPVFTYNRPQPDIVAGVKLRGGEMVFLTSHGQCVRLDADRHEKLTFAAKRNVQPFGGVDVLANGHVLLTHTDAVAEYDADGRPVW